MNKKFEINRTKIKGSSQLGRKVIIHDSKSDLPLGFNLTDYFQHPRDNDQLSLP